MSLYLISRKCLLIVQRRAAFARAFSTSYLFLRSLRCWTSSLSFQVDAICMKPYFNQSRSSLKRQSDGSSGIPSLVYSVWGI